MQVLELESVNLLMGPASNRSILSTDSAAVLFIAGQILTVLFYGSNSDRAILWSKFGRPNCSVLSNDSRKIIQLCGTDVYSGFYIQGIHLNPLGICKFGFLLTTKIYS